jgi:hypothetical protein
VFNFEPHYGLQRQKTLILIYFRFYKLLKFIGIINSITATKINAMAKRRLPGQMNF